MIRLLKEKDRRQLMSYLKVAPSLNVFIIGDAEKFGFDESFQEVWADIDDDGCFHGVLRRHRDNYVVYSQDHLMDMKGFAEIIGSYDGDKRISGQSSIIDQLHPLLSGYTRKDYYFCELKTLGSQLSVDNSKVLKGKSEDAYRVYELIKSINEFSGFGNSVEAYRRKIDGGEGRIYYLEDDDGEMISVAQTSAENSLSAMVVGVATKASARGQGLMSICLAKLCRDVVNEGKTLCLFYNNPSAGKIYRKIGFENTDNWSILTFIQR